MADGLIPQAARGSLSRYPNANKQMGRGQPYTLKQTSGRGAALFPAADSCKNGDG